MSEPRKGIIPPQVAISRVNASLVARRAGERRFRTYGRIAIGIALAFLVLLFVSIFTKGIPGFFQYYVTLEVVVDRERIDPVGDLSVQSLYDGDARGIIRSALYEATGAEGRSGRKAAGKLISKGAEQRLREVIIKDPSLLGKTVVLAFPMGVATAIYLEEFAPKNRITEIIEVNINNLAAVPSVVFGILGLAVFIGIFGMPRSIPLIGGVVLALMTLPTIIISSRAAIRAVPPSIRDAALGVGASKLQTVTHHVLPLAMPGMLTGTIIGMAQALGETAPLLMIGMVAFIVDIPGGVTDPGTVLPVQIFMWADFAERMFIHKTSAAIIVLLGFLILMNAIAIFIRNRLERRW